MDRRAPGLAAGDHAVAAAARGVLEQAWRPSRTGPGHCVPNPTTYPHLWLWDSCFHALAWAALGDPRASEELAAVFVAQTPEGFVPHMRYGAEPGYLRGPRPDASCFTQPAVHGIAVDHLLRLGIAVPDAVVDASRRALHHLFTARRHAPSGLVRIVHPWESGADDSPRWDDWTGRSSWTREHWSAVDQRLLRAVRFDGVVAVRSQEFEVCPVAFAAIAVHAARLVAARTGDERLTATAGACAAAIDRALWNDAEGLWDDLVVVGPRAAGDPRSSAHVPTLDGVLGALCTDDARRAHRALDQVLAPDRFGAPFGARYVPPDHRSYAPGHYWRGPAWPQLNLLVWLAARRWGRDDVAAAIAAWTRAGVRTSGFAEHWNPDTGAGGGAIPQTWAAVVVVMNS